MEIWNNLQPLLRFWLKMLNCECFPSLDSWKNFSHLNYISVSTTLCRKNSSLILDSFNILEVWKKIILEFHFYAPKYLFSTIAIPYFSLSWFHIIVFQEKTFFFGHKSFFPSFSRLFYSTGKSAGRLANFASSFSNHSNGKKP